MRVKPSFRLLLCLVGFLLFVPTKGFSYRCSRANESNSAAHRPSLSWSSRTIPISLNEEGTVDIPGDEEFSFLEESLRVWERSRECLPPQRTIDTRFSVNSTDSHAIGYNFSPGARNHNLILFLDSLWPHPGQRDFVFGLTTTTHNLVTGELLDADIELNTADFHFSTDPDSEEVDLASVMVHEAGHLLGLDHSQIATAAMDAQYSPGETNKRTLHCDDQNGIAFKYPAGETNGYCDTTDPACNNCFGPRILSETPTLSINKVTLESGGSGCFATGRPLLILLLLFGAFRRRR